jgi:Flp pilus assembly protein TadB
VIALATAFAVGPDARWRPAFAHPDAGSLEDAGWRAGVRRWEGVRAAAMAVSATAALALGLPIVLAVVTGVLPSVWIRVRAEGVRERARRCVGGMVVSAEAALRAGSSLPAALARAADGASEPIAARPLRDALHAFDLGAGLDIALLSAAERARDRRSELVLTTLALGIAERLPRERLADLLGALGERIAFEERLEEEVRARAAGARQQQWLLTALVPGIALYLALTMPALAATLGTDLGRFVLIPLAAALEVGGILLGRRVIRAGLG